MKAACPTSLLARASRALTAAAARALPVHCMHAPNLETGMPSLSSPHLLPFFIFLAQLRAGAVGAQPLFALLRSVVCPPLSSARRFCARVQRRPRSGRFVAAVAVDVNLVIFLSLRW